MGERDSELEAIEVVFNTLSSLDKEGQKRVIDYVFKRLNLTSVVNNSQNLELSQQMRSDATREAGITVVSPSRIVDIRTLKEQKSPSNDKEMAAIVGYYLSELAPEGEKKQIIGKDDLEKYFKQADYKLPQHIKMTLPQAKDAGYFDLADRGEYKLNPVGYNLVAHNLPRINKVAVRKPASNQKKKIVKRK